MTYQRDTSNRQKFTGMYRVTGSKRYKGTATESEITWPDAQDTTFISPSTGSKRTFLPGDIIDNSYQLIKLLGRGGMGVVFSCRHTTLKMEYALKLLSDDKVDDQVWARFRDEAKALAKLNHPGIVGIHNMGLDKGQFPYYVMDLLSGETLESMVDREGAIPYKQALGHFIKACDALSSAHLQGIIHRDVKPSNLMLVRDGQNQISAIKIVDFGIARLSEHDFARQSETSPGIVFGTPLYMSPEQCSGKKVDERTDIYSLGCTMFEALTGKPPFKGNNAYETFSMQQHDTPPTLAQSCPNGEFPEAMELAMARLLAKKPVKRYQTMLQLQHDLERIKDDKLIMGQGISTFSSLPVVLAPPTTRQGTAKGTANGSPPDSQPGLQPVAPQVSTIDQAKPKSKTPAKILFTGAAVAALAVTAIVFGVGRHRGPELDTAASDCLGTKQGP